MGALEGESNQTSSAATSNISDLKVHTPTSSDKVNRLDSESKFSSFSSSTSSPDSTLDDRFLDFNIEHDESTSTITAISKRDEQVSDKDKKASNDSQIPKSPVTKHNLSPMSSPGPGYMFESPPVQMMERNNDSKYRIPSSVFARNKSNTPDWSMASNESLFSIQMGGMSFTQDHYNFRSGELGLLGETSTSGQIIGFSVEMSTPDRNLGGKETDVGGGPNENAEDRKSNVEGRISHYSVESTSSTKSFVFPVLAGEKDISNSASMGGSLKICPDTPKLEQQAKRDEEPKTPATEELQQPKTPAAAPTVAPQNNWFSCFSCCS